MNLTEDYGRTIGRIEGKLDHLIVAHSQITRKWEELARDCASLHQRQEVQRHEFAALEQRLCAVEKPAYEFGRWRERALGALMLLSLGGALVGGSVVAFWQKMHALLR